MSFGKSVTLNTGAQIPRIGYGTWQAKPGEVGNGVYEALKAGYRHLDLAKVYGNQREVGEGIRRAIADIPGLKREDIFITSKLWNTSHRPEHVAAALDDTLAELGLEYLDLYLIHWAVAFTPDASGPLANLFPKDPADPEQSHLDKGVSITQTWKAMTELSKDKARAVGVSNFTVEQLEAVSKATGVVPAANQIERHPRLPGTELVDYCKSKNIIITAYSGFGNNTVGAPLLVTNPDIVAIAERLSAAQGKTVTPAQVLIAWGVTGGHTIIPKSVTASRIVENFQEVELDDEALATLKKLGEEPYRFNIPFTYKPKWNVDCFGDVREKDAATKTVISL